MINDKQLIKMITKHVKELKRIEITLDKLDAFLIMAPEAPLKELIYDNYTNTTNIISEVAQDKLEWIDWYIWENNCGKNGLTAVINGKELKVNTIIRLVNIIKLSRD